MRQELPGIVQPAVDIAEAKRRVHSAWVAFRDARCAEEKAAGAHERASEITRQRKKDLGVELIPLRKHWPSRGPNAKGWGDLLRDMGIAQQEAWDAMQYAGFVEEQVSRTFSDVRENPLPTRADAGIDHRHRKGDEPPADQSPPLPPSAALVVAAPTVVTGEIVERDAPPWLEEVMASADRVEKTMASLHTACIRLAELCRKHEADVASPSIAVVKARVYRAQALLNQSIRLMEGDPP